MGIGAQGIVNDWRRKAGRRGHAGRWGRWAWVVGGLAGGLWAGMLAVSGAEAGRFVLLDGRGDEGSRFAYWDLFLADDRGYNFGFANPPALLGGEDEVGNPTTLTEGIGLTQTGTATAFVTSTGAIYSFSHPTAFRVDSTASGHDPVSSVIFQTLTGGRRLELDAIRLEYTAPGGELVSVVPSLKALDDPQTGAFAERLVSAFQWDLSGLGIQTFRLVFGAPGSSMLLWEAQLDVRRGGTFQPELGYVLVKSAWPLVRYQAAGRVIPQVSAGAETRFFRPGTVVRLAGAPARGFAHVGWLVDGAVHEVASLDLTFGESDETVAGIFTPLSYATWRTHWFDHANAVLGLPADHLNDAVSGPSADPDGDGRENFCEFAFGGDPYAADAHVPSLEAGSIDDAPTLTYQQPASAAVAVEYELQASQDLKAWVPVPATVVSKSLEPSGYWRVTVRETPGDLSPPRPFLRMEARARP